MPTFSIPGDDAALEDLASHARSLLGVDRDEPIKDRGAKAVRAGVMTFVVKLGPDSADAASVLLNSGAVAVVNGSLRVGRRRLSLAHELGHVLVKDEYTIDWRTDGSTPAGHHESALDRLARALLLPRTSLPEVWQRFGRDADDELLDQALGSADRPESDEK